ncbi:pentapeptide repeat-containing protein [Streptomyces fungicidicus]|uniref:pentapeptide repeat-containing protein n=1 Tax=Streptomyces fungicidicus TaxID=68203 RepID=UPI003794BAAB
MKRTLTESAEDGCSSVRSTRPRTERRRFDRLPPGKPTSPHSRSHVTRRPAAVCCRADGLVDAHSSNYDSNAVMDLHGVYLSGVYLPSGDLHGADRRHMDLSVACLNRVNLRDANLAGANLGGALLFRADLRGANLDDAQRWRLRPWRHRPSRHGAW